MKFLRKGISLFTASLLLFMNIPFGMAEHAVFYSDPIVPIADILGTEQLNAMLKQEQYDLHFCNQVGDAVLHSVEGLAANDAIPTYDGSQDALNISGKFLWGWSQSPQGSTHYTEIVAIDFTETISSLATDSSNTANLFPWYADLMTVQFLSDVSASAPTQYIMDGQLASVPEAPVREGYTFTDWMIQGDEGLKLFDFANTPVCESLTLYASWTAAEVKFTLAYMYQNADDDGYTQVATEEMYAPCDSHILLDMADPESMDTKQLLAYSDIHDGTKAGDVHATLTDKEIASIDNVRDHYFIYRSAQADSQIKADGSTILFVYYDRAEITLTFTHPNQEAYLDQPFDQTIVDRFALTWADDHRFPYRFTARYGQDIQAVWPQTDAIVDNSTAVYDSWKAADDTAHFTAPPALDQTLFTTASLHVGDNGKLTADATFVRHNENIVSNYLLYAATSLENEPSDFTYNNSSYTIHKELCEVLHGEQLYQGLDGATMVGNAPMFSVGYADLGESQTINLVSTADDIQTIKQLFDQVFAIDATTQNAKDQYQLLLYDRNLYSLVLHLNTAQGSNDSEIFSAQYMHGEKPYDDDHDLIQKVEAQISRAGYEFAGWYLNAECTDDALFTIDATTVASGDLNLYAKWQPIQYTAHFYLSHSDSTPYVVEHFDVTSLLTNHAMVDTLLAEDFLCWCLQDSHSGILAPFDFDQAADVSLVSDTGEITLYAAWKSTYADVSYHMGSMGDDTCDDPKYNDDANVTLKDPSVLWPDNDNQAFVAWQVGSDLYAIGDLLPIDQSPVDAIAIWAQDCVSLIYHANYDGLDDTFEALGLKDTHMTLSSNIEEYDPVFAREGYALLGWALGNGDISPEYAPGDTITLHQDNIDLYAVWGATVTVENLMVLSTDDQDALNDLNEPVLFKALITSGDEAYQLEQGEGYTVAPEDGTITFALGHDESIALTGIPVGMQLTVQEESVPEGFTVAYQAAEGEVEDGSEYVATVAGDSAVTFTNTLSYTLPELFPDTGVLLDSLPYLLILAVVLIGLFIFLLRRRRRDGDD